MPAQIAAKSATAAVEHETGLHTRPASMFVQTVSKSETDIFMRKAGGRAEIDAKNGIAVLSLGVGPDEEIIITVNGGDGEQAVGRLVELARNDFGLDT